MTWHLGGPGFAAVATTVFPVTSYELEKKKHDFLQRSPNAPATTRASPWPLLSFLSSVDVPVRWIFAFAHHTGRLSIQKSRAAVVPAVPRRRQFLLKLLHTALARNPKRGRRREAYSASASNLCLWLSRTRHAQGSGRGGHTVRKGAIQC